jgi:hypothetical protein
MQSNTFADFYLRISNIIPDIRFSAPLKSLGYATCTSLEKSRLHTTRNIINQEWKIRLLEEFYISHIDLSSDTVFFAIKPAGFQIKKTWSFF